MPPKIRISFAHFWRNFDPRNNIFCRTLAEKYDVIIDRKPDIVFYSVFPGEFPEGDFVKVFYTGEGVPCDYKRADWSFAFEYDDAEYKRHLRLPLYVLSTHIRTFRADWGACLIKSDDYHAKLNSRHRKGFCAYIAYQDGLVRCLLFDKLNREKSVTAPGRSRNNAPPIFDSDPVRSRRSPDWQEEKRKYLVNFRYAITCENTSYPGYTTEKIIDAMIAGCIPIYWGNPEISRDFNPLSMVDVNVYERQVAAKLPFWLRNNRRLYRLVWRHWIMPRTVDKVVKRVLEIDGDERLYKQVLKEPWFHNNEPNIYFDYERFRSRMMVIAKAAVTRRKNQFGVSSRAISVAGKSPVGNGPGNAIDGDENS